MLGFSMIWRIYWLALIGLLGAVTVALVQSWRTDREIRLPA
jgi:hypothetical protein